MGVGIGWAMRSDDPFVWHGLRLAAEPRDGVAGNDNEPIGGGFDADDVFRRVVSAYGSGRLQSVSRLLTSSLFERLNGELSERRQLGHVLYSNLVQVDKIAALPPADPSGRQLEIRFGFRMIVALRDAEGCLLAGDPERPLAFAEIWTFERQRDQGDWQVADMIEDEC